MQLTGIHHLTAVTADVRENYRFYTRTMGMRLVKRSVNQDDVSAYHLFYADAVGNPGTDLTFFDWDVPREQRGTHSIVRTGMRVDGVESLEWWADHLSANRIAHSGVVERDARLTIEFDDFEGQRLAIVDDGGTGDPPVTWEDSPVPAVHQLRGLGPILISVPDIKDTDLVLTRVMHMRPVREYFHPENARHTVHVYEMGPGGAGAELHVAAQPDLPPARSGAGGAHHVAFRVPDDDAYAAWQEHLASFGMPNSGPVDRFWFKSLYFREPNGILFELATDGPGFGVDEDLETLGEKVVLPPFLEPRRDAIVSRLKPLE
jgi:glyoxalase family protein